MSKIPSFIFILLLLLYCSVCWAQDSSSAQSRSQRNPEAAKQAEAEGTRLLFQKHDVNAAIESFKKSVKLDPWYAHGYMMLGLAYMQASRWDDAQWAFGEVTKIDPDNPQACIGVGSAQNEQKDYAGAEKTLLHCLELKPGSAEAEYELGRSCWGLNKWEAAEQHTQRAISLNKDYSGPHFLMGNLYLQEEDPEDALAEFQEYLKLDPQGPQAAAVRDMIAKIQAALKQK
jgi:Flp pilus assembly protein TadD